MGKFVDLTGMKFNNLKVIKRKNVGHKGNIVWECQCECGNSIELRSDQIRSGHTKSCGCLHIKHGHANKERLYNTWKNMKRRCYDPNNKRYASYGGKGVTVCDEWREDYLSFRNWAMSNGYDDSLSIDRIDVNGNYEPNNCRWETSKVQANNVTRNRILEYNGIRKTMSEWADKFKIPYIKFNKRIQMGWNIQRIVNELGCLNEI